MNDFKEAIIRMKDMADFLMPLSYPKVDYRTEEEILYFKKKQIILDGYHLLVSFSKADYDDFIFQSVQLTSEHFPTLPFNVVCKVGRAFLGDKKLAYTSLMRGNFKSYIWIINTVGNRILMPEHEGIIENYEGFEYYRLKTGSINLL